MQPVDRHVAQLAGIRRIPVCAERAGWVSLPRPPEPPHSARPNSRDLSDQPRWARPRERKEKLQECAGVASRHRDRWPGCAARRPTTSRGATSICWPVRLWDAKDRSSRCGVSAPRSTPPQGCGPAPPRADAPAAKLLQPTLVVPPLSTAIKLYANPYAKSTKMFSPWWEYPHSAW